MLEENRYLSIENDKKINRPHTERKHTENDEMDEHTQDHVVETENREQKN